jgi:hypothetical protein
MRRPLPLVIGARFAPAALLVGLVLGPVGGSGGLLLESESGWLRCEDDTYLLQE